MVTQVREARELPTVRLERPWSKTTMGLSTMRGEWHLHVGGTSVTRHRQPQVLPLTPVDASSPSWRERGG